MQLVIMFGNCGYKFIHEYECLGGNKPHDILGTVHLFSKKI